MKISNDTLSLLKWMTTLNGGIRIDPGTKIYSKSATGSMLAYAEVKEDFPHAFCTANLQKFLATVSLFDDPEFEFYDKHVVISSTNGKNKSIFYQSKESCVQQPNKTPKPQTEISMEFHLKSDDLQKVFKAASVMNVPEVCFRASGGLITFSALNKAEESTDTYDTIIGECNPDIDLIYYFKKNYFKILTDFSYDVEIYSTGLSKFSATDSPFNRLDVYAVTLQSE